MINTTPDKNITHEDADKTRLLTSHETVDIPLSEIENVSLGFASPKIADRCKYVLPMDEFGIVIPIGKMNYDGYVMTPKQAPVPVTITIDGEEFDISSLSKRRQKQVINKAKSISRK